MIGLPSGSRAGFTLIEVVVSLALMGLTLAALGGGLRFGTVVWEKSLDKSEEIQSLQVTRRVVDRLVSSAMVRPRVPGSDNPEIAFSGETDSLKFVGHSPLDLNGGPANVLEFDIERGPKGANLVLAWRLYNPDGSDFESGGKGAQQAVLLEGIEGATFSYFGGDTPEGPRDWHASWSGRTRLPELVKLEIMGVGGARVDWPELIVAPRITALPAQLAR